MKVKIRSARISDVKAIHQLINYYANRKEMLPRSLNDIYENLPEFVVAEVDKKLVGCCALHIAWEDLAEVKALAIRPDYQGKGLGSRLVRECEKRAKKYEIRRVFALTFKPKFFQKLSYQIISRDELPHKIWGECIHCPMFPDCGEVPVRKNL